MYGAKLFDMNLMPKIISSRNPFVGKENALRESGAETSQSWGSAAFEAVSNQYKMFLESKVQLDSLIREIGKKA